MWARRGGPGWERKQARERVNGREGDWGGGLHATTCPPAARPRKGRRHSLNDQGRDLQHFCAVRTRCPPNLFTWQGQYFLLCTGNPVLNSKKNLSRPFILFVSMHKETHNVVPGVLRRAQRKFSTSRSLGGFLSYLLWQQFDSFPALSASCIYPLPPCVPPSPHPQDSLHSAIEH